VALPAFARRTPRCCALCSNRRPAGPTTAEFAAVTHAGTDRRTDRRTPDRCIDPASHTMRADYRTTRRRLKFQHIVVWFAACQCGTYVNCLCAEVSMRLNHTSAMRQVTRSRDQSRRRQRNNIVDRSVDSPNCMSPILLLLRRRRRRL